MKMLFDGFWHGHVDLLYRQAPGISELEIAVCLEEDEKAALTTG